MFCSNFSNIHKEKKKKLSKRVLQDLKSILITFFGWSQSHNLLKILAEEYVLSALGRDLALNVDILWALMMFIHTKGGTSKLDFHVFCRSKKKLSHSFFFYITKKLAQKLILAFSNSKKNCSKVRFWHFLICRKKLAQKLSWRFLKRKTIAKKHILAYFQKQKMVQKQILAFSTIKKREVKS